MMEFSIEKIPQVGTGEWLRPARTEKIYTELSTPVGNFSLHRKPARQGTAEAKADGWEEWSITLDGSVIMLIEDIAYPWTSLHKRMRSGAHGRLEGKSFQAHARRSPLPSKRIVRYTFDDCTLSFEVQGSSRVLYSESGGERRLIAEARKGKWACASLTPSLTAVLCFHTVAELDIFLESPLWDIPIF
ncbi:hypothetical protein AB0J81_21590 [Streptomyces bobili]|uniref:hypothetical protein n=1 Tax=Streptomyces bobili TaxID=67280 RepID=UPI00341FBCAD